MSSDESLLQRRVERLETENERLQQRIENLRAMLAPPEEADPDLSPQQRNIMAVLRRHRRASLKQLIAACETRCQDIEHSNKGKEPLTAVVQSQICNMRRKGVPIVTVWGWGYELARA